MAENNHPQIFDPAHKVPPLCQPAAYPEKTHEILPVETHMSWVFLTDHYAYKLKKPEKCDFLDFSTLDARYRNCRIEIRLNRRLAPDVYFGIVPLTIDSDRRIKLDGAGEVIDWLVKMRRLPEALMLDYKLNNKDIYHEEMRRLARVLGQFYRNLAPAPLSGSQQIERLKRSIRANHRELIKPVFKLPVKRIDRIVSGLLQFITSHETCLTQRIRDGRVVEGHGDLRPEHICMEEPVPVIFDCLEFNQDFRTLDAADDLAYLSLECRRLGYPEAEKILFSVYRTITNDTVPTNLIRFYQNSRALLRIKLARQHILNKTSPNVSHWHERAMQYLLLAEGLPLQR